MKKTIIITGAGKGLGRAITLRLAQMEHRLLLVGRNEADLAQLAEQAKEAGSEATYVVADLVRPESAGLIVETCIQAYAGIDVLINNAGVANPFSIESTPVEQWDLMMAVNARAPFLLCKKAIPYLRQSTQATIINISSVVGRKGYVNQAAYTASKHALTGFTKALAKEVQPMGIRVHLISPGGVATETLARTRPDLTQNGLMQPEEIAEVIAFLLSMRGNAMIDEINLRRLNATPFD
ncbi:MAG: SDR family oxidoreductase [Bacteroidales bacterium]|nr:SDR family oxidoreductase [Bacteroidales bacterium]HOK97682.1 SDR family oxidoreductase [Bacteroidales bacterium]HPO65409.1 SDR family oxidoreductase [Bacteroidales bacterium]